MRSRPLKLALSATLMMVASATASQAAGIDGSWARGDGEARVTIGACGGDICAINTWIKPGTPSEKVGDRLVMTVHPTSDGEYTGTAFDPQRNLTYRLDISATAKAMTTKGCVLGGLVCKTVSWTRLD